MIRLTIFSPSYNNRDSIQNLYQSLLKQTCKEFEWLIVDDGSTDHTEDLISDFQQNADFKIHYFYQDNQGKYMAHYNAIQQCDTELFCCIDADVFLYENSVESMLREWDGLQSKSAVIGIGLPVMLRDSDGTPRTSSGSFNGKVPAMGRLSELTSRFGYRGEVFYMFSTRVLRELTVPEVPGEKFWTESGFYFPLNKKYKVRWLNIPIGETIYLAEGLTKNRLRHEINSPRLTLCSYKRGAVYHPVFLHRVANCCLYISWKRLLGVDDTFPEKIPVPVYLMGYLLEPFYCRAFRKKVRDYLTQSQED